MTRRQRFIKVSRKWVKEFYPFRFSGILLNIKVPNILNFFSSDKFKMINSGRTVRMQRYKSE